MISKNSFLIFNNVLRELYQCQTYGELGQTFLPMLKMLIPFRYASIMRSQEGGAPIRLVDPLCTPAEFAEAERNYMSLPMTTTPAGSAAAGSPPSFGRAIW